MAITVNKQIPFLNLDAVAALVPEIARNADETLRFAGQPCQVFVIVTDGSGSTNPEIQTTLTRVLGGFVYNATDDTLQTFTVLPKSTDATIAVITGALGNSKTSLLFVYGLNN